MIAKVQNRRVVSCYSKKELKEEKIMIEDNDNSNDVLLESLRVNMEKVKKDKMELESKELAIQKQIDKITQGE